MNNYIVKIAKLKANRPRLKRRSRQNLNQSCDTIVQPPPQCLLSNPNCPPISKMDHYNARCLWKHWTWGQHMWPKVFSPPPTHPPKTWTSKYEREFKVRNAERPPAVMPTHEIMKSRIPMQFQSSSRADYPQHKTQVKARSATPEPDRQTTQNMKLIGRSETRAQYPKWESYKADKWKPIKLPYRGNEVPFSNRSTYEEDINTRLRKYPPAKKPEKHSQKATLNFGEEKNFDTTSRNHLNYHKISPDEIIRTCKKEETYLPVVASHRHFESTSKNAYLGKQPDFWIPRNRSLV